MDKFLKKIFMITPLLVVAALVAGFLPSILSLASPGPSAPQQVSGNPADKEREDVKTGQDGGSSVLETSTAAPAPRQLSQEEVRRIALAKVDGKIVKFELDDDKYEVETTANGKKYEMDINLYTGQISEFKIDGMDENDRSGITRSSATTNPVMTSKDRISAEEAQRIALAKVDGKIVECELDDDQYEIEIRANGKKYDMKINAFTGKIVENEVEDLKDRDEASKLTKPATTTKPASTLRSRITSQEARRIALARVNGRIVEFGLDDDKFEVTIYANSKEYDMEISAYTGKILELKETDREDDHDRGSTQPAQVNPVTKPAATSPSRISMEQARGIALARINGTITEADLDDDAYEFEIQANGNEYEISVHAYTGKILDVEVDDHDNDSDHDDDYNHDDDSNHDDDHDVNNNVDDDNSHHDFDDHDDHDDYEDHDGDDD